jgi:hypothetical protein
MRSFLQNFSAADMVSLIRKDDALWASSVVHYNLQAYCHSLDIGFARCSLEEVSIGVISR